MNLDGLKRLLGQLGGGAMQAGKAVAQGAAKAVPLLAPGGVASGMNRLINQQPLQHLSQQAMQGGARGMLGTAQGASGMPNTAAAGAYALDPTNPRYLRVDPGPSFGYPEDRGQYGGHANRLPGQFGAPFIPQQQEDSGNVWGPRGMQPLDQLNQNDPWQNASGPYNPRY